MKSLSRTGESTLDATCLKGNDETITVTDLLSNNVCPKLKVPPIGACSKSDRFFGTDEDGCKDLKTNLVWSKPYSFPGEYQLTDTGLKQAIETVSSYCNRIESDKDDWRAPTVAELKIVAGESKGGAHFANKEILSGYFVSSDGKTAIQISSGASTQLDLQVFRPHAICVREAEGYQRK